jgi:hypothetical protein
LTRTSWNDKKWFKQRFWQLKLARLAPARTE